MCLYMGKVRWRWVLSLAYFLRAAQDCPRDEHELSPETNFYNCPKIFRNEELDEDNEDWRFLTLEDKFLGWIPNGEMELVWWAELCCVALSYCIVSSCLSWISEASLQPVNLEVVCGIPIGL